MAGARPDGAVAIGRSLADASLPLIVPPEGFAVSDFRGPLAPGEAGRAAAWARSTVDVLAASGRTAVP